jgi:3-hydroxyacyl-CoA dehydrogenase / 3-hydroxy-2-methylbutyryl-CoA dehydrogenase
MTLLHQTVALITGGCSGLGAAAAKQLVRHGARVCIADITSSIRNKKGADGWYQELLKITTPFDDANATVVKPTVIENGQFHTATGPAITYSITDVTDTNQIIGALNQIEQVYGEPVNTVVNCAGIAIAKRMLSKKGDPHPMDDFMKTIMINTVGTFNVNRLAAQRMIARNSLADDEIRGCIINTASIAAWEPQIG